MDGVLREPHSHGELPLLQGVDRVRNIAELVARRLSLLERPNGDLDRAFGIFALAREAPYFDIAQLVLRRFHRAHAHLPESNHVPSSPGGKRVLSVRNRTVRGRFRFQSRTVTASAEEAAIFRLADAVGFAG